MAETGLAIIFVDLNLNLYKAKEHDLYKENYRVIGASSSNIF